MPSAKTGCVVCYAMENAEPLRDEPARIALISSLYTLRSVAKDGLDVVRADLCAVHETLYARLDDRA